MHGRATGPLFDSPSMFRYGLPSQEYRDAPAVATDFVEKLPGAFFYKLVYVFCRLVTDANVANREVIVEYRDQQANRLVVNGEPVVVTAGSTQDYSFGAYLGRGEWPSDSTILVPLSPMLLLGGGDFRVHIVNVQAGDQLSRIRFGYERYYSTNQPPQEYPTTPDT